VASAEAILSAAKEPAVIPSGPFWRLAYHPRTLVQICQLREALLEDCTSATRILLRAILLGALHGPRPKGKPSYFSNQALHVRLTEDHYEVRHVVKGDSISDVLKYVEYDPNAMIEAVRKQAERAVGSGRLTNENMRTLMQHYEQALRSYTFLADEE
jgi:hypothetical protein